METINLNTKENIIKSYSMKPTLFYDIEGTLVEKNGKNIKVEKTIADRQISYLLRLKDDIQFQLGNRVKIDKENIISVKVREKEEKESVIDKKDIMEKLNLQYDEESQAAIKNMLQHQVPITKENMESFLKSKGYLQEIIDNMDFDSCLKLMDMNIDLNEDSLQDIAEALAEIKKEDDIYMDSLLNFDKKLSYKEAKKIAKKIYGRSMGKDIYDSIIALHGQRISINKKNIEKVMEAINKVSSLRDCENTVLIDILKNNLPVNIETLYRNKYCYNIKSLGNNFTSPLYEKFTIVKEQSIEEILELLDFTDMVQNEENIKLLQEFMASDMDIRKENLQKVLAMKADVKKLIQLLNEESIASLMNEGVDLYKEDIGILIDIIKDSTDNDGDRSLYGTNKLPSEIEELANITDKELLSFIKSGNDFKIKNIREVIDTDTQLAANMNEKLVERTITISNIFNTIGNLKSNTIALAIKRYTNISLSSLYKAQVELDGDKHQLVEVADQTQEDFIRQEYTNARNNIGLSLLKESIKDGMELENLPLDELNQYIYNKTHRYRQVQDLINKVRGLEGREEFLIPKVINSELHMSIEQLADMNSILNHGYGIGNILNKMLNGQYGFKYKSVGEEIQTLERKIKDTSYSLKEGKKGIKEGYKKILASFQDLNDSFNSSSQEKDENIYRIEQYLKLQNQLSSKDLVLQIPILTDNGYNNVNLIVPDIEKGIDSGNMTFYFNLNTENLDNIKFNLQVTGDKVDIEIETERDDLILDNRHLLEEGLNRVGYRLENIRIKNKSR